LLRDAFAVARLPGMGDGAFLINLSRAFERYLAESMSAELARRSKWSLEVQPVYAIGPTELQPDLLLRRRGQARFVLDAKWKAPDCGPDAADLHQILAYASITGSQRVGLIYPGRRFARREFSVPGTQIQLSLFRVRVVGTTDECQTSITRLVRVLCRD